MDLRKRAGAVARLLTAAALLYVQPDILIPGISTVLRTPYGGRLVAILGIFGAKMFCY